jgi:hypothetical protein
MPRRGWLRDGLAGRETTMTITYEGECCQDCLCFMANGECGDARESEAQQAKIAARWTAEQMRHMVAGGEDCGFSWRACDACAGLAGDRYTFAVLGAD